MLEHETIERLAQRNAELRALLMRMLSPEDLGFAVTAEVRDAARQALGMQPVETRNGN